jgi:hypothetical protein
MLRVVAVLVNTCWAQPVYLEGISLDLKLMRYVIAVAEQGGFERGGPVATHDPAVAQPSDPPA